MKKLLKKSMMIKIIFYYLISNILLVFFLSSVFYYSSKYIIMKKEIQYTNENAKRSADHISLYVDKLKNIINLMSVDDNVHKLLLSDKLYDNEFRNNIRNEMNVILNENKGSILKITIIGKNGKIISSDNEVDLELSDDMMKQEWYRAEIKNSNVPVLNPIRKKKTTMNMSDFVLSISKDINILGENVGVVIFDISYKALNEYLKSVSMGDNNDNIILDDKNNVIYYKNVDCFVDKKCVDKFINYNTNEKNSDNKAFIKVDIKNTNWTLISISEMNDLKTLQNSFLHIIIIIFLVSLTFTTFITALIILKLIKPLKLLGHHMQNFENSLSEFTFDKEVSTEVEVLTKNFNAMINKIKYLREYEIKALHSQINPHFLYNTLDTIIWMAEFEDKNKVISITKSLANFFRLSLSNGNEKISLEDEIKHVKEYLFIQKQRYEDKLTYNFNVDEKLLKYEVPKIIIQPIVENSIYHGIKNIFENGIINIDVYEENENIMISVKDNGIGFEKSKGLKNSKIGGVGIQNVDKRIKYYYGNDYGIIRKDVSVGAEVVIILPKNNNIFVKNVKN